VKIKDIILEDLNTGTGTPNPDTPKPDYSSKHKTVTPTVKGYNAAPPAPAERIEKAGEKLGQSIVKGKAGDAALAAGDEISKGTDAVANTLAKGYQGFKKGVGAVGKGLKAGWRGAEKVAGATADAIGDMAQGAQQYIPGTQDRAAKLANQQNAKPWIDRWNQGVRANPEINTPEQLQQFATKLATNRAGQTQFQVPVPKDMSRAGVAEYLTGIIGRVAAGVEQPGTTTTGQTKQTAPGNQSATQTGGWITTPDGVQLKPASGNNPTWARYGKQIYRLTSDDRWVDVRDKPVSQTMVALLNQALSQT
jgi:hypothetical protein